jgi:hypothetical protein
MSLPDQYNAGTKRTHFSKIAYDKNNWCSKKTKLVRIKSGNFHLKYFSRAANLM